MGGRQHTTHRSVRVAYLEVVSVTSWPAGRSAPSVTTRSRCISTGLPYNTNTRSIHGTLRQQNRVEQRVKRLEQSGKETQYSMSE